MRSFDDFSSALGKQDICVKVDIERAEQQFVDGAASEWRRISDLVIEVLGPAVAAGFIQNVSVSDGTATANVSGALQDTRKARSPHDGS